MLTLFRFLSRCPLWILHGTGWVVGWVSYCFSASYRQRFRANVAQAGVSVSTAHAAIAHAGRMLMELPYLWMRPSGSGDLLPLNWEGQALIEAAHAQGALVIGSAGILRAGFDISVAGFGAGWADAEDNDVLPGG